MLSWLIFGAVPIFLLEFSLALLIKWLRRDFQWLITRADLVPRIDQASLGRFLQHGFSAELGWERKPGTSKTEEIKTVGECRKHVSTSTYTIGSGGERVNPGHEKLPLVISTYGDSFAFSRHVNDRETWQWHLSELTGTNVVNYGVGNYGLDQACLRMESKLPEHPSRVVIMMVVPETISRVVNIWKHYSEYGNVLGFKGRFLDGEAELRWKPNPVQQSEDFQRLEALASDIQKNDDCFKRKFLPDLLDFPYTVAWLRNPRRHIPLVAALCRRKLYALFGRENEVIDNRPWQLVLERNFAFVRDLYQDSKTVALLAAIVRRFKTFVSSRGATPVFVLAPYLHDISYLRKTGCYYQEFWNAICGELCCIDLGPLLLQEPEPEKFFVSTFNAAHFSPTGNRKVAEGIFDAMVARNLFKPEIK